jgi:hypothetical protein
MGGLFIIGFIANALVKAVDAKYHMTPDSGAEREQMRVGAAAKPASA